ncbi:hypothetical protein L1K37_23890, partial [Escherichia coli]|nr:hypothetical protein [Escherichia coli]
TSFPKMAPAIKPNTPPINNDHKKFSIAFPSFVPLSHFYFTLYLEGLQKYAPRNSRKKRSCDKSVQLISEEATSGTP